MRCAGRGDDLRDCVACGTEALSDARLEVEKERPVDALHTCYRSSQDTSFRADAQQLEMCSYVTLTRAT